MTTTVFDLGRRLRAALEALPYPVYRRAVEKILFEQVERMYGHEMSPEQRDVWDRTVAVARSGIIVPSPFDPDGIAPDRVDPVLAGLLEEYEAMTFDARPGLHRALGVMQVYTKELAGVYPPYEAADFLGYAFESYPDPPLAQAPSGIRNLTAITYQPADSLAGDELRASLRLVETFANDDLRGRG